MTGANAWGTADQGGEKNWNAAPRTIVGENAARDGAWELTSQDCAEDERRQDQAQVGFPADDDVLSVASRYCSGPASRAAHIISLPSSELIEQGGSGARQLRRWNVRFLRIRAPACVLKVGLSLLRASTRVDAWSTCMMPAALARKPQACQGKMSHTVLHGSLVVAEALGWAGSIILSLLATQSDRLGRAPISARERRLMEKCDKVLRPHACNLMGLALV